MQFTTKIDIPTSDVNIDHKSRILMFGSCFIENIGEELTQNKFNADVNPFGVLYNPLSISRSLDMLIRNRQITEDDLFGHKGLYHSFYHHSKFSDVNKEAALQKMNHRISQASKNLPHTDILFITFGTAYVYGHKELELIVGNCHKLPASAFHRSRLSIDTIVENWSRLIDNLHKINPKLQIIFTVSPIRHLKDGAHENQLSKSILLLAVDKLCSTYPYAHYFPSYEIVLDELRDYRFYNEDMVHPSNTAIQYIWQRFGKTYFSDTTMQIINEWKKISAALAHRPFNTQTSEYKQFLKQTLLKLQTFENKYPYIYCANEITNTEAKIKDLKLL